MNIVQETISKVMIHYGFRHKYEVAEYFGVTPQALSTWPVSYTHLTLPTNREV